MIKVTLVAPNVSGLGEEAVAALRADIVEWVGEVMADVAARMRAILSRSGRVSQPGEAPSRQSAVDAYADSWETVTKQLKRAVEGRLGSKQWRHLGRKLEYGTRKMRPRPHVGPVLEQWKRDLEHEIANPYRG